MPSEPTPTSERARKRAAGKTHREALINRREAYFDLLVSGYSIEQIASHTKTSVSAVRRAVGQAWRSGSSMRLRTTPASRSPG
jgi:transposase